MTVVVCAAHADDEIIGAGGMIAKIAKEEEVIVMIFSYGIGFDARISSLPPMMSEEKLTKVRVAESKKAGEMLGVKETIFLGMKYDLTKEINEGQKQKIVGVLDKYKPRAVYFHSSKDGHKDHLAVHNTMEEIIGKMKERPEIYTYQINLFDFSEKDPKIIVDVSAEFKKKLAAVEQFKSQRIWTAPLKFMILLKGIFFGRRHGFKFAEYFYAE